MGSGVGPDFLKSPGFHSPELSGKGLSLPRPRWGVGGFGQTLPGQGGWVGVLLPQGHRRRGASTLGCSQEVTDFWDPHRVGSLLGRSLARRRVCSTGPLTFLRVAAPLHGTQRACAFYGMFERRDFGARLARGGLSGYGGCPHPAPRSLSLLQTASALVQPEPELTGLVHGPASARARAGSWPSSGAEPARGLRQGLQRGAKGRFHGPALLAAPPHPAPRPLGLWRWAWS